MKQSYENGRAQARLCIEKYLNECKDKGVEPSEEDFKSKMDEELSKAVRVTYTPRYSSFLYRGVLHLTYIPYIDSLTWDGWELSQEEIATFKAFFSNERNIRDFFDNRVAYSVSGQEMMDCGPYSLKYEWNGKTKEISVGVGKRIPYNHPFEPSYKAPEFSYSPDGGKTLIIGKDAFGDL